MTESLDKNRRRLFALDAGLRAEADVMLDQSGLGSIIREEGFKAVGSYAMQTMTWRNLDFERTDDHPDIKPHWELGARFAQNGWVWGLRYIDASRDPRTPGDEGFYWRIEATNPRGGEIWTVDLWTARQEVFERGAPNRPLWESRLTEDTRYHILVIKEALCKLPEYGKSIHSWHIYEAVLEHGIRSIDEFWGWWKKHYGK